MYCSTEGTFLHNFLMILMPFASELLENCEEMISCYSDPTANDYVCFLNVYVFSINFCMTIA